jgi:hypothetical protein
LNSGPAGCKIIITRKYTNTDRLTAFGVQDNWLRSPIKDIERFDFFCPVETDDTYFMEQLTKQTTLT